MAGLLGSRAVHNVIVSLRRFQEFLSVQANRVRYRRVYTRVHDDYDFAKHIREAAAWLCRAQDFGVDRGVSYGAQFGNGFLPSYPETTGYIIPTFTRLSDIYCDPSYLQRAIEMGDWEIDIQMESGAVMGGRVNPNPSPAVFNTGQVLLGWSDLYRRTESGRFFDAAHRASNWLTEIQDADGCWRRFNSQYADPASTVYNVKAAWGLCLFGKLANEPAFVDAATRNAAYAMAKQAPNGWFSDCCLTDPQKPLLHTLAYTLQGLLEIGILIGRDDFVRAVKRTALSLCDLMRGDGFLPGRIRPDFTAAVSWCCMTGNAQTSVVMSRLLELDHDDRLLMAVRRLNRYLMARHDICSDNPTVKGGLTGSWPVHGDYGRFMILNWPTKFLIDALIAGRTHGV